MSAYSISLHPHHAEALAASGVTPDHASKRGYVSVDTKVRLGQVGITPAGRRVPGLLVPQLRADGSTWGYQYRPDSPRDRGGKPVKYETPVNQRNGIDVPPGVGPMLDDPAIPLWVTEGVKKADAVALAGLCIVALPGVWSWIGKNDHGGKVAVAEWRDIALNGRRVVLAFDGDVSRKRSVRAALTALAGYLESKGAQVEYAHLPDTDDKTGIDDFLVGGHSVDDLRALVRPEPPALTPDPAPDAPTAPDAPVSQRGTEQTGATPETGRLLSEVREWLSRFICTMDEADLDLLTLWAAHTHLCVETYTTPRLVLDSPVPGSGKTTVLEHLEKLCHHPVQMASISSPALLTRMLDAGLRTILIDEADRSLDPKRDGVEELLAVLNSGYKRGGTRPTLVPTKENGWQAREMPTFAPVVMAGNNPNLPEDTKSRAIRVLLLPDLEGRVEESDWELIEDEARALGGRLATWAEQVRDDVRVNRPELPEGIKGRGRERWAPLKRVSEAAGGRWPAVVDVLAIADKERMEMDREDGMILERPGVALLGHLYQLWPDEQTFAPTTTLLDLLTQRHPEMWGAESTFGKALTAQRLGRMLAGSYGIHSTRLDRTGPRGYTRAALERAWHRMGVSRSAPVTPDPSQETGASGASGETGAPHPPREPSERPEPSEPSETIPPRFVNPAGAGRCHGCGFHTPTQGHRPTCTERTAS